MSDQDFVPAQVAEATEPKLIASGRIVETRGDSVIVLRAHGGNVESAYEVKPGEYALGASVAIFDDGSVAV